MTVFENENGLVNVPESFIPVLEHLQNAKKNGFVTVKGYVSKTDYLVCPVADKTGLSCVSVFNLYKRRIEKLKNLQFSDIKIKGEKLKKLDERKQVEQFLTCKQIAVESANITLDGVREDARRIAHDTFNHRIADSVSLKLDSAKNENGDTDLILKNGNPVSNKISLGIVPVFSKTVREGWYKGEKKEKTAGEFLNWILNSPNVNTEKRLKMKVDFDGKKITLAQFIEKLQSMDEHTKIVAVAVAVNSGEKVLMDKCIKNAWNKKSLEYQTWVLTENNFKSVSISGEKYTPEKIFNEIQDTVKIDELRELLTINEEVNA
jgi:hypothetical protein